MAVPRPVSAHTFSFSGENLILPISSILVDTLRPCCHRLWIAYAGSMGAAAILWGRFKHYEATRLN